VSTFAGMRLLALAYGMFLLTMRASLGASARRADQRIP
jgi:hypothetical protein